VVHVQFLALAKTRLPFELWFLHLAKLSGISIVYTVHNVLPHDSGDRYRERFKRIYSMADHLICHDPSARDRLVAEFDIEPRRITVIPHGPLFGVKRDALESRRRLKLSQDQLVVLWQGIMRPYKGLDVLIDAWRRLQIQGVNATLVIAGFGEPSMVQQVRELVASLPNPESVRLDLRFIDVDELETYYSAADILVYPYRDVTTSGALMTGIGHAKPIVASDLPAFRELLSHNHNALLVRSGDADELAASLRLLIDSPELRHLLGRNIGKNTTNPTWDSIAAQTVGVYETASRL
jgi:glycosyltransferase involved in cell wall biosynthesis